jgi:hypothetical protein
LIGRRGEPWGGSAGLQVFALPVCGQRRARLVAGRVCWAVAEGLWLSAGGGWERLELVEGGGELGRPWPVVL